MASISPIIRTKGQTSTIYIRLRSGRKHDYTISTGLTIDGKKWNIKTKRPKETTAELKQLKNILDAIVSHIQENLNNITTDGLEPSKRWLETTYNKFTNKEEKEQNASIEYWIKYIIDNPNLFENSIGEKGLSINRIRQLNTLFKVFKKYQKNHVYKIVEIDQFFYDNFNHWLLNKEKYGHNTAKKYSDDLIAIGRHARRYKIPVSQELDYIKRIKTRSSKTIVLEHDEILRIENLEITNERLLNTRKWFLLGLQVAQRISDLLPLTEYNIQYHPDLDHNLTKCFVFTQKKSQNTKEIVIPIDEVIEEIIKDGLPTPISDQRFNEYLKEICKMAEIDRPTKGAISKTIEIDGKKRKRNIEGVYPKWQLITSHTLRKTATTHYYQVFGAKVKHITGHSKEETVNIYVNQDRSRKLSQVKKLRNEYNQLLKIKEELKPNDKPKMTVLKKVENQ
ncbi:phage integrase SAM-like domain-containing protein [Wenyingzhuangia marina]|uniref:Phage integrase family protein n=1 Tax=Wenyingzhuangia marina TaxID=1195760 RepID=A0A1M5T4N6_9FLAO|nr:tyrosine-type recombinase/integrase [Wenyingzhuangia marina]SHH45717.1 Phage integrase family protein [Wenyingzhuangia marina]